MADNSLQIERFIKRVRETDNIVFLGGAGVSTESGIPDFRSAKGLYSSGGPISPEEMLSHHFFIRHTDEFYDFYKKNMLYPDAQPNVTHKALARLEQMGKLKAVITQNIDNLHQAGGSRKVFELHGSVYRNYCMKCGKFFGLDYILKSEGVPVCDSCGGTIKPDVVLYEESLDGGVINGSVNAVMNAKMMIVGGTSLNVYPAAGLINYYEGHDLVLINRDATPYDSYADIVIHDSLGKVFGELMERLESEEK